MARLLPLLALLACSALVRAEWYNNLLSEEREESLGIFALHRGGKVYEALLEGAGTMLPSVLHRSIREGPGTSRVIVIGDVHGCLDELHEMLGRVKFEQHKDTLIFTGDLGNRGPFSVEVIKFIQEIQAYSVRGNNDDAALAAWEAHHMGQDIPLIFDWVKKLPKKDAMWMYQLPWSVSVPHLNVTVVHAGLVPNKTLQHQSLWDMYEVRELTREEEDKFWHVARPGIEEGEAWAGIWDGPQHVVFGHDASRGLQEYKWATGLDTGCCYGRQMTAAILVAKPEFPGFDMELVHVQAHARYA